MSPVPRRLQVVALVVLAVAGIVVAASRVHVGSSAKNEPLVRRAPDRSAEAELVSTPTGVPELWIAETGKPAIKVGRLEDGEGVKDNFAWSALGTLLAFETYDLEGHSPLTTSHVWVVRRDGSGLVEISLPSPNERFSTQLERWLDDNTVLVRATLLSGGDVLYTFSYDTKEVRLKSGSPTQ